MRSARFSGRVSVAPRKRQSATKMRPVVKGRKETFLGRREFPATDRPIPKRVFVLIWLLAEGRSWPRPENSRQY